MKKILLFILIITAGLFLNACNSDAYEKVFKEAVIGFQTGDSSVSVTKDITLPSTTTIDGAELSWISSHPNIILATGAITRPKDNTTVTLILKVLIDGIIQEKSFFVTVVGTGNTGNDDPNGGNPGGEDPNGEDPGNVEVPTGYTAIANVQDFLDIRDYMGKYMLTSDIDFKGIEVAPLGRWGAIDWQGVKRPGEYFGGTFDGNGFALKNFTITASNYSGLKEGNEYFGASLFPNLNGIVRNLNIINATITGDGFSGGIAGLVESGGVIENVYFQGSVTSTKSWGSPESMAIPAGGIAGMVGAGVRIENVIIDASITGGHVFFGYAFHGDGRTSVSNLYAVSETLLPEVATQLTGVEKEGETQYLLTKLSNSRVVYKNSLTTLSLGNKWSTSGASRPFLVRIDKKVPDWAK